MMTVGSLFAGIGGFDLGFERAGFTIRWQVENDKYCTLILRKHWPDVRRYGDITLIDWNDVERVDLVCGGFPCQPVSVAGKRRGTADERWLWPEFARCLRVLRPRYVLVENVPGLLVRGMGEVVGDLARFGYDAEWEVLSAAAFGAPHLRRRIWLVAYDQSAGARMGCFEASSERWGTAKTESAGLRQADWHPSDVGIDASSPIVADAESTRLEVGRQGLSTASDWWATEPDVGRMAHGVPARVDRLRGLGNAVVPQVVEWIGRQILKAQ